jgi:hypothetical protein
LWSGRHGHLLRLGQVNPSNHLVLESCVCGHIAFLAMFRIRFYGLRGLRLIVSSDVVH